MTKRFPPTRSRDSKGKRCNEYPDVTHACMHPSGLAAVDVGEAIRAPFRSLSRAAPANESAPLRASVRLLRIKALQKLSGRQTPKRQAGHIGRSNSQRVEIEH